MWVLQPLQTCSAPLPQGLVSTPVCLRGLYIHFHPSETTARVMESELLAGREFCVAVSGCTWAKLHFCFLF